SPPFPTRRSSDLPITKLSRRNLTRIQLIKQLILLPMRENRRTILNPKRLKSILRFLKIDLKNHVAIVENDIVYILHIFLFYRCKYVHLPSQNQQWKCRAYSSVG